MSFVTGFLTGCIAGACLGVMFAAMCVAAKCEKGAKYVDQR